MAPRRISAPVPHAASSPGECRLQVTDRRHDRGGTSVALRTPQGAMHMKKTIKPLHLNKQQIRILVTDDLTQAIGGWIRPPLSWSCPQPSASECCPETA